MKQEVYYFSHDSNALTDTKILNMRADYGLEGYGLYWAIIEMMRNEENYKLELNPKIYKAIKVLTNTTIDVEKYIQDCINEYDLFKQDDDGFFYSNSLLTRMEKMEQKSKKAKESISNRWGKNTKEVETNNECNTDIIRKEYERNTNVSKTNNERNTNEIQNKNKIKENKNKIKNKDDDDDDNNNILYNKNLQEIFNAYENNIGCITPMTAEILQSYVEDGLSSSLIIQAFKIAVASNNRNLKYIKGILNNWKNKNLTSVLDVENYEKQRQERMHPKEETKEEKKARELKEFEEYEKLQEKEKT